MSLFYFDIDDSQNPFTLNNLLTNNNFEEQQSKTEKENQLFIQDEKKSLKVPSKNNQEAKNVPKNMGILIKNYLTNNHKNVIRQNLTIQKFIRKVNNKKNYTRKDLKVLFSNDDARNICKQYFSSFQIIQDILKSSKIGDSEVILKYIKKLFIGTHDPSSLSCLKYTNKEL
ncbi:unnamed protein product [Paramecium sonneborni]|uniref:Uncharacterized protein n=1 Tax=Paramecium sonneborni TaxID=65129 RepID=A0A8S1NXM4_9CILI|nr:unnamed protein product [Paramecium sonneborni]